MSDVVRGQVSKFTLDALVGMLGRAGRRVRISVSRWPPSTNSSLCTSVCAGVERLRLLAVDRILHTQFPQPAGYAATLPGHTTPLPNVFLASEVNSLSGIQGALEGGEKAAAAILGDLDVLSRPRGA